VTVKLAGLPSEADAVGGVTVAPLLHTSETVTGFGLLSEKSLFTWNVAVALFRIVQDAALRLAEQTPPR
jgi:hypothetical protein